MKKVLYFICQCTWGFLQTLMGCFVFLANIKCKHFFYHGAVITEWKNPSSVSLGLFVFVTKKNFYKNKLDDKEAANRLLVHEYGHTIQSLFLGPLYLIIIGIPSATWASLPILRKKRIREHISYFEFFTEKWANLLGEKVTGEKSMGMAFID